MFGEEVRKLLVEVIRSWQVIAVTIALVIYVFIINYAARTHHPIRRPRKASKLKAKEVIPETPAASEPDELGLEEEN